MENKLLTLTPELIMDICAMWEHINSQQRHWLNIQSGEIIFNLIIDPDRRTGNDFMAWHTKERLKGKTHDELINQDYGTRIEFIDLGTSLTQEEARLVSSLPRVSPSLKDLNDKLQTYDKRDMLEAYTAGWGRVYYDWSCEEFSNCDNEPKYKDFEGWFNNVYGNQG